jgi:hypothetical protein
MTDLLARITADIEQRLTELRPHYEEHERLLEARGALGRNGASRTTSNQARRGGARRSSPKPTVPRAPRGENRRRILAVVEERPGVSAAEISSVAGIKRNVTYATLSKLVADGALDRVTVGSDTGYRLAKPPEG